MLLNTDSTRRIGTYCMSPIFMLCALYGRQDGCRRKAVQPRIDVGSGLKSIVRCLYLAHNQVNVPGVPVLF